MNKKRLWGDIVPNGAKGILSCMCMYGRWVGVGVGWGVRAWGASNTDKVELVLACTYPSTTSVCDSEDVIMSTITTG